MKIQFLGIVTIILLVLAFGCTTGESSSDDNSTIGCGCDYCAENGCTCEAEGQTCSFPDYNACAGNCECTSTSCSLSDLNAQ